MILAVLLDGDGRPVCTEMWPGNTADVGSLIPVIDRPQRRFQINRGTFAALLPEADLCGRSQDSAVSRGSQLTPSPPPFGRASAKTASTAA